MKIAIIAAMEEEVALLRNKIQHCQTETIAGIEIYSGKINNSEVLLLKSGIGKVAAAACTTLLLSRYKVDAVINTGSAGGLDSKLNLGDIVVSTDVCYHDADLTVFGYQMGQMAGCPATFATDSHYRALAKQVIKKLELNVVEGLICSGDAFIHGDAPLNRIRSQFPQVIAVEMEAAAIGHVCWLFKTPFIVVRAISDVADKASPMTFDEFLPIAAKQSSLVIESMLNIINP